MRWMRWPRPPFRYYLFLLKFSYSAADHLCMPQPAQHADPSRSWLDLVSDEDLAFVRRFVLASGSLKEMAQIYGVSYPTVRLRLDRLIGKIQALDNPESATELERVARGLFAEGKLDVESLKSLLRAQRRDQEQRS